MVVIVDYHMSIQTKLCQKRQERSSVERMAAALLKRISGVSAIPQTEQICNPSVVIKGLLSAFAAEGFTKISGTHASLIDRVFSQKNWLSG